jgi:PAS domain S-box-containing protein
VSATYHDQTMQDSLAIHRRFPTALLVGLAAAVGYVSAKLGGFLIINDPQTLWPLWPGCAALVALLLLCPRRTWAVLIPAGLIGFILYDLQAGVPIRSIAWLVVADIAEIFVTAEGLNYFFGGAPEFDSLRAFAKYCLVTVILGPLVASLIGIRALNGDQWVSWRCNFLSEGLSFLTVTPAILGLVRYFPRWRSTSRAFKLELVTLLLAVTLASYAMFVARGTHASPAVLYSLVPFLLWSALRFGSTGASTAASIVGLLSVWGAIHGRSPFSETDPIDRVFFLQLFLLFTAVPFMVLAVLAEERKQQEAVLRESEERFRLMADTAPTMVWMSGTNKLCNFFSRGWLNFTGRTLEQELGEGWVSGVHPEDRQRCLNTYSSAFDSRRSFEMEYRLRRYDGEHRWILDYGVPRFSPNGTFCGYIGSCLDITERKLSEMSLHDLTGRLIHAQEQERARIARELHDDISQRMAFLQIGLEQFEQSAAGLPMNRRKELRNLTNVASEVSSDLHSISHQLHPARLDLQGLVAAMGSLCREFMAQHELQIDFVHEDIPNQIPTDVALCLFRIAQEALRNVVKHGKTSAAQVKLSACADGIDLCVADTGSGFDPECAHRGLGLISMSERLRILGGRLEVGSAVSRGTQIRAWIPLPRNASDPTSNSTTQILRPQ